MYETLSQRVWYRFVTCVKHIANRLEPVSHLTRIGIISVMKEFFTIEQAYAKLGISRTKLWRLMKMHDIQTTMKPGNKKYRFITAQDLVTLRAVMDEIASLIEKPVELEPPRILPPVIVQPVALPGASQGHPERSRPSRRHSDKPPLPEGWISFEEAWEMTGIAGNWEKSQVDKALWATPGPFLRNRSTILWALSPKQQEEFFARYGRS